MADEYIYARGILKDVVDVIKTTCPDINDDDDENNDDADNIIKSRQNIKKLAETLIKSGTLLKKLKERRQIKRLQVKYLFIHLLK